MQKKLLWLTLILVIFGLAMLSSAGVIDGQKKFGSSYYYVTHQILFGALPGVLIMLFLSRINYQIWRKLAFLVLFFSLGLMILVFVPSLGRTLHGSSSWLALFGYTFQPAEILKLALVIYLAAWFGGHDDRMKNWAYGTAPFFTVLAFVGLLLMLQPDVGTLGMIIILALGMFFVAGGEFKHAALIGLVAFIGVAVLVVAVPYRFARIKTLLDPSQNTRGSSYQLNQSLIAIGSGGLLGVGYGNSTQKIHGFLPEPIGDTIFAIIAQELGLVGSVFTVGLFVAMSWMLVLIAKTTADKFGRLMALGMAIWISSQAFVNIAAISGLGPLTGIPLPFISYGSTSLVSLLTGMGIVLNIAKRT